MARLKFHQRTFDLLSLAPLLSDAARQTLEKAARTANRTFPASALEWLSLENGIPLLRRSGEAEPLSIKALAENLQASTNGKLPRITFLRDISGICWAFDLVEKPDPPVLVRIPTDDDGESWRTTADRFSDFVLCWIWDRPTGGHAAWAQVSCTLKQVRRLAEAAIQQPISKAWPTHKTFRLQFDEGRIRIGYRPDGWSEVALWSETPRSLARLVAISSSAGIPSKAFFSDQPAISRLLASL